MAITLRYQPDVSERFDCPTIELSDKAGAISAMNVTEEEKGKPGFSLGQFLERKTL